MQIKIRYHFTLTKMTIMKRAYINAVKDVEK